MEQQQILANKDLDLPTQQELLAQFRCDEIAAGVVEGFTLSSKAIRRPVETGTVVQDLGSLMNDWFSVALSELFPMRNFPGKAHVFVRQV